jgi:hypothetical protein
VDVLGALGLLTYEMVANFRCGKDGGIMELTKIYVTGKIGIGCL